MISSLDILLKSFLSTLDPSRFEKLTHLLPKKIASTMKDVQVKGFSSDEDFDLFSLFDQVHYSWFLPTIKSASKDESKLFLASLPREERKKLKAVLSISPSRKKISSHGNEYLRSLLIKSLLPENNYLLPRSYLPKTSAMPLLDLSKKELIVLIDYLGLYDLSKEIKKLIDKELMEKISSCLSLEKQNFLKELFSHKEPFSSAPLELTNWDEKKASLLTDLHKRGMNRLAKAISFQHPDFIWHITHTLDIGRGLFIDSLISDKTSHTVSGVILSNILELLVKLEKIRFEAKK